MNPIRAFQVQPDSNEIFESTVAAQQQVICLEFTEAERCYLMFTKQILENGVNSPGTPIFLSQSLIMQNGFCTWLGTSNINKDVFSKVDLNSIVTSVWNTAKNKAELELKSCNDDEHVISLKNDQTLAETAEKRFHNQGLHGRVFTRRQAQLLLESLQ